MILGITLIAVGAVSAAETSDQNQTINQTTPNNSSTPDQNTTPTENQTPTSNNSLTHENPQQSNTNQPQTYEAAGSPAFTIQQIITDANTYKNNIDTNHALPTTVTVNNIVITTPQFLELMANTITQLNKGLPTTTLLDLGNYATATNPKESITTGTIAINEYTNLAQAIENYMTSSGRAPDYAYQTSLGTYMRYETLTYLFSTALTNYNTNLPSTVQVRPWAKIINPPTTFTIQQIITAANTYKNSIDTNHQLPTTVTVGSKTITTPQFLELMANTISQLNKGLPLTTTIDLGSYTSATNPKESITTGTIGQNEYTNLAQAILNYMTGSGRAPDYAYQTSLGTYMRYETLTYLFSTALSSYNLNLPSTVQVKPWAKIINPPTTFTIQQVMDAARTYKNSIDTNHALPATVTVGSKTITTPQFLELMANTITQLNKGLPTTTTIDLGAFNAAANPKESIVSGTIGQNEYTNLAQAILNYMTGSGRAPDYAYQTSLGTYMRYETLTYLFSSVLSSYNLNLPSTVQIKPWAKIINPPTTFTIQQVMDAARTYKNSIDTNHALPATVTVGSKTITTPQFLELMANTITQLNKGLPLTTTIDLGNYATATNPKESINTGTIGQNEYTNLAQAILNYMTGSGRAPDYAYQTSLGTYMRYETLTYLFSTALSSYNPNLPSAVQIKPWAKIINPPVSFTLQQVINAAATFKNSIDTNHQLPTTVTVNNIVITTPQFLELMANTITQLNKGLPTTTTIDLGAFNAAANPKESIVSGTIGQNEYTNLAQAILNYMTGSGRAPDYAYQTSLGTYMRYETLTYLFSTILTNYNTNLPNTVQIKPWPKIITPPLATFTIAQILDASSTFKNSIDTNHALPASVTVNNIVITTPQFLELMANTITQLNKGLPLTTTIDLGNYATATNPKESITTGTIGQNEYTNLAQAIENYMTSSGRAPDYAYQTSLGTYMRYETLTYLFSTILTYYKSQNALPSYVTTKSWENLKNPVIFNLTDVLNAATKVNSYIISNHCLPNSVTVGNKEISMSQFLEIITTATLKVSNRTDSTLELGYQTQATNPIENISAGRIYQSEYLKIAEDIVNYMNSAAYRAPNYAYGTSLGYYMRYESLIFMYSQILDYYNKYTSLPVFYGANPWRSLDVPSDLLSYIDHTLNCQSNDLSIMSLAGSLTVGLSSKLEQATSIFNWVRDNIDYSFYYNTLYYGQEGAGALRTLSAGSGNCVDTTHLLIALARAAGIPAKYVHAECTFSSGTYGHVFARLYVNGQWLNADGTSYRNTLGGIANWDTNTWVFKGEYRELPF